MSIITKKINNQFIFYDKDIEINIEELFSSDILITSEDTNVQWLNSEKWVKKHYFRKGMMKFMVDSYLFKSIENTRSFKEFNLLNYLYKSGFNTCRPIVGWVEYHGIFYKANIVTESISSITLKDLLQSDLKYSLIDKYNIFKKVGVSIAKMHLLNVNHGDLNISNILIDKDIMNVWIIDFDKSSQSSNISSAERKSNIKRFERSLVNTGLFEEKCYNYFIKGYHSIIND